MSIIRWRYCNTAAPATLHLSFCLIIYRAGARMRPHYVKIYTLMAQKTKGRQAIFRVLPQRAHFVALGRIFCYTLYGGRYNFAGMAGASARKTAIHLKEI